MGAWGVLEETDGTMTMLLRDIVGARKLASSIRKSFHVLLGLLYSPHTLWSLSQILATGNTPGSRLDVVVPCTWSGILTGGR